MAKKADIQSIVAILLGQHDSGWVQDQTGESLKAPNEYLMPVRGKGVFKKGEQYYNKETKKMQTAEGTKILDIRYIKHCPSIFVDFQIDNNYEPREEDMIIFLRGTLMVNRTEESKNLYDFMDRILFNEDNAEEYKDLFPNVDRIFSVINRQEEAAEEIFDTGMLTEALVEVSKLYKGKKPNIVFEHDLIDRQCQIFNINENTYEEKVKALQQKVVTDPEDYLTILRASNSQVRIDVLTAFELKVLEVNNNLCSFTKNKLKVYQFESKTKDPDARRRLLIDYFSSIEGEKLYADLKIHLEAAKQRATEAQ